MTDPFVEGISCYNAKEICKFFDYSKSTQSSLSSFFFYTDTPTQQQTHILDTLVSNVISPPQQLN